MLFHSKSFQWTILNENAWALALPPAMHPPCQYSCPRRKVTSECHQTFSSFLTIGSAAEELNGLTHTQTGPILYPQLLMRERKIQILWSNSGAPMLGQPVYVFPKLDACLVLARPSLPLSDWGSLVICKRHLHWERGSCSWKLLNPTGHMLCASYMMPNQTPFLHFASSTLW